MLTAVTDDGSKFDERRSGTRSTDRARRAGMTLLLASLLAVPALATGPTSPSPLDETLHLAAFDPVILGLFQDAGTAGQPTGSTATTDESWLGLEEVDASVYNDIATDILTQSEIGYNRPGEFRPESRRALKAGEMLIYPYLQQRFGYNDNIFLEDDDEDDGVDDDGQNEDFFSLTKGGALARLTFAQGEHNLEFGGEASWNQFFDETDDSYFEGTAGAAWNFHTGNVYGKVADRFERREDPIEIGFAGDLFQRNINTLNGVFGTDLDAINLEGEGNWLREDYADSDFDYINRDEWYAALRPGVYLNEDSRLYIEGVYGERIMNDDGNANDSWWAEGSLGITGEIAEHVNGRVQAGYHYEQFDDNGNATVTALDDSHDDAIGLAAVRWEASNETTVDAQFIRTQQFSADAVGDPLQSDSNFQVVTRADLTVTHVLYPDLLGRVGGFIESARVDNADDLTRYGIGVGVKYRLTSYLDLDADYSWKERDVHGTTEGEYTNNIISIGGTLQF